MSSVRDDGHHQAPRHSYRLAALRGSALSFAGYGTSQLLNFLAYAILARLVTPHDFGLYTAGGVVTGVAMLFAESGMLAALITRQDRLEEAHNTALIWNVVSGIGLAAGALALSPLFGLAFGSSRVGVVSAALSGVLLVRALSIVPDALLQRRLSFLRRVVVEPLGVAAFGVAGIVLAHAGSGVWALVAASYAAMAVRTIVLWCLARWRPRPSRASLAMWRELAGYARPVVVSEVVRRLAMQIDVFLIGRFVGIGSLGQYRYATRLAQLPLSTWVGSGAYVLLPVFARLAGDLDRLRAGALRATRWMAMAVFPVSLLLFALGLPAALVVFGSDWRQAGYGVMALTLLPIGHAVVSLASEVFKAMGHTGELARMHVFHAVTTALVMLALLPLGMLGVAAGASVGSLAVGAYSVVRLQAVAGMPASSLARGLVPPLVCSCWMGGVGYALDHFLVHAAGHGTALGLVLLVAEAIALLVLYATTLAAVSSGHRRMLGDALRGLRRWRAARPADRHVLAQP